MFYFSEGILSIMLSDTYNNNLSLSVAEQPLLENLHWRGTNSFSLLPVFRGGSWSSLAQYWTNCKNSALDGEKGLKNCFPLICNVIYLLLSFESWLLLFFCASRVNLESNIRAYPAVAALYPVDHLQPGINDNHLTQEGSLFVYFTSPWLQWHNSFICLMTSNSY